MKVAKTRNLAPLFKVDTTGKNRTWRCWVVSSTLHREYGVVDGKMIVSERTFTGTNIGRSNETTPKEQAWKEANKEWTAHIDKGYAPDSDDDEGNKLAVTIAKEKKKTGGTNVNASAAGGAAKIKNISRKLKDTCIVEGEIGTPIIPMKASVWELSDSTNPHSVQLKVAKHFSKVKGTGKNTVLSDTPFYGQEKYDGLRVRVYLVNRKSKNPAIVMTSNSGKQFPYFHSLRKELLTWLLTCRDEDIGDGLDGELYCNDIIDENGKPISADARFSTLSSICGLSRSVPHVLEDQLQFWCFDVIDKSSTLTQVQRFEKRDALFAKYEKCKFDSPLVIKAPTTILNSISEVVKFHGECAEKGYEGIVLRTFTLKCKPGTRSMEMRKFKMFQDEEFEIVGCKLDKGVSQEHFVWVLVTENGDKFNSKPMGTREEKIEWYKNRKTHIGKFITVKFQEKTEDGIPRFPIAKAFRSGKGTD